MKRFYREVTIAPAEHGHRVLLDGRPMRTPARQVLAVPTASLAAAIAAEWRGQVETIRPQAMPLTRLASTAIDRMPAQRQAAIDEVISYAETDLVCYRATEPFELVEIERWGSDVEVERRHKVLRRDVTGAAQFLRELDQPASS